jgi:dihydrofolate synthase/folylpolyglutamate synthase
MFQRIGAAAFKKDLGNTIALLEALDNPHFRFPTIHVAGTNGKGSVSSMLNSVLMEAGYNVGLYTSPHLREFTERIRVNGLEIPQQAIVEFTAQYKKVIEEIKPSFFEVTVVMAFDFFAQQNVDIAVIEVGLGGRLDSTNVIMPEVSVITNISMDHQQFLGNTLAEIAGEKAGIIKKGVPVVIGQENKETKPVFERIATEKGVPIHYAQKVFKAKRIEFDLFGQVFQVKDGKGKTRTIATDLAGIYQLENVLTALTALDVLSADWEIPEEAIQAGFGRVKENSGLQGRMTVVRNEPLTITDVAHNEAGLAQVLSQIGELKFQQLHLVWGMVDDKDISKILTMLPKTAKMYYVRPDVPRGLDAHILAEQGRKLGLMGQVYPSVKAGIEAAWKAADRADLVYIGGSTFVVAEVDLG